MVARDFSPWNGKTRVCSSARRAHGGGRTRVVGPPGRRKTGKKDEKKGRPDQGLKPLATIVRPPGGEGRDGFTSAAGTRHRWYSNLSGGPSPLEVRDG